MKKFILTIAVIGVIAYVFAACNAPSTEETVATDSTSVVVDSTTTDTAEVIVITNDTDSTIVSQ